MTRCLVSGLLITAIVAAALLVPGDGNAGPGKGALTIVYTGDVVGTIEPCG
ncbi:hypothetical protein JXA88_09075 [Candidatus Fermentibacteria bacterium]|nr:hypothetical protein [Candidatus Fermentibacteria bacterium]